MDSMAKALAELEEWATTSRLFGAGWLSVSEASNCSASTMRPEDNSLVSSRLVRRSIASGVSRGCFTDVWAGLASGSGSTMVTAGSGFAALAFSAMATSDLAGSCWSVGSARCRTGSSTVSVMADSGATAGSAVTTGSRTGLATDSGGVAAEEFAASVFGRNGASV